MNMVASFAAREPSANLVTMEEVLNLSTRPFKKQRDHGKRAGKVRHIPKELFGDALVFHAGVLVHKAVTESVLVDGYTRTERVRRGSTNYPKCRVLLIKHLVNTEAELELLYRQINSLAAAKRGPDSYYSGLRSLDIHERLKSTLVLEGPMPSAVSHAMGGKHSRDVAACTESLRDGILWLDSAGIQHKRASFFPVGVIAALLVLGQYGDREMKRHGMEFVRILGTTIYEPRNDAEAIVFELREAITEMRECRQLSGQANINRMMKKVFTGFIRYWEACLKNEEFGSSYLDGEEMTQGYFMEILEEERLKEG